VKIDVSQEVRLSPNVSQCSRARDRVSGYQDRSPAAAATAFPGEPSAALPIAAHPPAMAQARAFPNGPRADRVSGHVAYSARFARHQLADGITLEIKV